MPYQGSSKLPVQVSVCCEACGTPYTYQRTLKSAGTGATRDRAIDQARVNMSKMVDSIQAGSLVPIADHKPCPQCGYVQSWMEETVRRRRGWQRGLLIAFVSYLLAFPFLFLIGGGGSSGVGNCLAPLLLFGMPVLVYFVARAIIMKRYQPNKGRATPPQTNRPTITLAR